MALSSWAPSQPIKWRSEAANEKNLNLKSHLKPGIRCMFISIAGLENVGKWDLSANISWWVTTRTFGCSVFSQTGTWPFVNRIIFLIQGAYFWKDLIEYFKGWRSLVGLESYDRRGDCDDPNPALSWFISRKRLASVSSALSGLFCFKISRNSGSVPFTHVITRSIGS